MSKKDFIGIENEWVKSMPTIGRTDLKNKGILLALVNMLREDFSSSYFNFFLLLMIATVLQECGFSGREAEVYLLCLEFGEVGAATIARKMMEPKSTVHSVLKNLVRKGCATETMKGTTQFYTMLSPKILLERQQATVQKLAEKMPELLALSALHLQKPKMFVYDGFTGFKTLITHIFETGREEMNPEKETFLSFFGVQQMAPQIQEYFSGPFLSQRFACPVATKTIIAPGENAYTAYSKKYHDYVEIADPLFAMDNEIVVYGKDKVAILLYHTDEVSGVRIDSQTLHDGLKSLFNLVRKSYKNK